MSAFSDFLAKQKVFNDSQAASIDKIGVSVDGLTGDVKTLNDKITELQNSAGQVSPEDQALIDALQAQGQALSDKVEAASTALSALDDLTPPAVPAVPPTA